LGSKLNLGVLGYPREQATRTSPFPLNKQDVFMKRTSGDSLKPPNLICYFNFVKNWKILVEKNWSVLDIVYPFC
jgi:hypothetical protein